MESGKHEKNGTSPVRECDEIVSYLNEEGEEAEEEAEVISEASEDEGMDRVNLVDLEDESEVYEAGEPPADQEDIEEMDDEMEHCMDDNGDVRVNLEEFTEVEEAEDINAASCVESELSTDIHLEGNNSESVAEEDVTKQQILAAQKAPSKLSAVPAHPNAIKSPLQQISTADVKKTVVGKPGTEASNKTPAKVVPAQRSAAVTRKLNAVPAKPAVVAKSNPAKPTVGQKIVTSTPKPSQNLKAVCLKAANISAIPNSHRVNGSSQNKASPSLETHDRTFDVQVDDFDGIDVEKPSDQSKTCVSMKTANKAGFTTNTRSGAIAKSSEQSNGSVDEGGFPVVTVAEESSKTDNAEPGEKKDENDAKPENSEAAITNLKTKDEKSTSISHNLWVSGLSSTTKATDLKALFGKYGKVLGAKVVTSARSPGWRCYGLVTIASADETTKCIQHLHRTELHGKMISVERVKTGGPARTIPVSKLGATNHSAHSGTIQKTSISGCSNIALNKSDDKKPAAPDKEGVKKCSEDDKKKGIKDEGKKSGKKEDQKESNKDVRHGVKSSKDHQRDKKSDKPSRKSGRESRYTSGIRDRNRYKDSEKRWEQRARDILSFEKIRAERERERLRQKELQLRSEERFRMEEIEKERQRQKAISRKQREEALQLEREKEKLRIEREKLEHERQKAEQLCKETARLKKIAENKIRREQDRLAAEQRAVKRPFDSTRLEMDNLWEKSAKKPCKESDFKSVFSEAIQYSNKSSEYELKAERYGHSGHFHQRQNNYHNSDKEDHRRLDESRLDRDYRKERPDKRGSHQDLQGEVGARPNHNLPGGGTGNIWSGQNSLWPSDHVRHDSRSEWKTERNMQPVVQRHETTEAVTAWGGPVNNQRKVEAGWGRDSEQDRTVSDRWIGMTSTELSQHQRGIGDMTNYNQRGIGDNSNYKSLRGHESNLLPASMTQGYLKSSNMNSGSRVSRQADSRFNIAAITARRF